MTLEDGHHQGGAPPVPASSSNNDGTSHLDLAGHRGLLPGSDDQGHRRTESVVSSDGTVSSIGSVFGDMMRFLLDRSAFEAQEEQAAQQAEQILRTDNGDDDTHSLSSMSRVSNTTDAMLLSDPTHSGASLQILSVAPPQADDDAGDDRPLQPPVRPPQSALANIDENQVLTESNNDDNQSVAQVSSDPVPDDGKGGVIVSEIPHADGAQEEAKTAGKPSTKTDSGGEESNRPSSSIWNHHKRVFLLVALLALLGVLIAIFVVRNNKDDGNGENKSVGESGQQVSRDAPRSTPVASSPTMAPSIVPTLAPSVQAAVHTMSPSMQPVMTARRPPVEVITAGIPPWPTMQPAARATPQVDTISSGIPAFPTPSPTSLKSTLLEIISARDVESAAVASSDPASPQAAALAWLVDHTNLDSHSPERIVQRYALVVFYHATLGDGWNNNSGWLVQDDECLWFNQAATPCTPNGEFVYLVLADNNLVGQLPNELGLLTSLVEIYLNQNQGLSGGIPATLGLMPNLGKLDLAYTNLTEPIPAQLGSGGPSGSFSSRLMRLNLEGTPIGGPVPAALSNLLRLRELLLIGTVLTGTMPPSVCDLGIPELWADCDEIDCPCCNYCCYNTGNNGTTTSSSDGALWQCNHTATR